MVLRDNEPVEGVGILPGIPASKPVDYDVDTYQVDGEKEDENVDYVDSVSTMSTVERTFGYGAVDRTFERDAVEHSILRDEDGREQIPCRGRRRRCCGSSDSLSDSSPSDSDSSSSDSDSSCDFDHSSHGNHGNHGNHSNHGNHESYNIHRDPEDELQVVNGDSYDDNHNSNDVADMEVVGSSSSDSDSSDSDEPDESDATIYIYKNGKRVKAKRIRNFLRRPKPECKIKSKDAGKPEKVNRKSDKSEDVSDFNAASRNSTDHISTRGLTLKSAIFPSLPVWTSEFGHGNKPSESPDGDRSLKFGSQGGFGDRPIGYSEYGKPYYSKVSDPWANVKTPFQAKQLELLEMARKLSRPQY